MVVLLKNNTRELRVYNVGDKGVTVHRTEVVQNKRGQVGTRTKKVHVSSSITLLPGERKRVPGIMLKQSAVKRDIAKGVLTVVKQDAKSELPKQPQVEVKSDPLPSPTGSHPVEEEGSVNIAEFTKAQKAARKGGKRAKE